MRLILWLILGTVLSFISLMSSYTIAAEQVSKPLASAQLVEVEGASSTYHLVDRDGRIVTAVVPSQSASDIQQNRPNNTVHVTLASIDATTNQLKVVTRAGQTLVLRVASEALQGLQIGDQVEFVLPAL